MANKGSEEKTKGKINKSRTLFTDFFTDYYKTNREYAKQNEEAVRKQEEREGTKSGKKPFSRTEKIYVVIIVLGLIGIGVRYLFF